MRLVLLVFAALAFGSPAYATDRSFPDISVTSPSGQFQLEARSPGNRVQGYRRWQDNFVYTMSKNGRLVWSRNQADQNPKESSPVRIVLSDDGWTAIQTDWDRLVFVDDEGQNCARIDDIKTLLTDNDRREFTTWSTGGVIWSPFSLWHFVESSGNRLFVIRLWWGYQLALDPVTGKRVDITPATAEAIRKSEVALCRAILRRAAEDGLQDGFSRDVSTAALFAGRLGIRDAIPHLKELEKSEHVGLFGGSMNTDLEPGEIDPFFIREFTLRKISQLSLRRLGVSPAPLPVYEFPRHRTNGSFRPKALACGAENAEGIEPGMAAIDVLESLGSPDFVSYPEWSYDCDGPDAKSITIEFVDGLVRCVKIDQPLWEKELVRDRLVFGF